MALTEEFNLEDARAIAIAQAKKILDRLDKEIWEHSENTYCLSKAFYQQLRKEVEE